MKDYSNIEDFTEIPQANFRYALLTREATGQHVLLRNAKGRLRAFFIRNYNLETPGRFRNHLLGLGDFRYCGSKAQLAELRNEIANAGPAAVLVDRLGWQADNRLYALNNALITTQGDVVEYNALGIAEFGGKCYYVPSAAQRWNSFPNKFIPEKSFRYVYGDISFGEFGNQFVRVHREPGMLALVFSVACLFSSKIFATNGYFPVLFLYGAPGSGKTQMTRAMQHLWGDPRETRFLKGRSSDAFSIRRAAPFVDALAVFDEFSNSIGIDGFSTVNCLSTRDAIVNHDDPSVDLNGSFTLASGVVLSGNEYPSEEHLFDSFIITEMLATTFSGEEQREFIKLTRMMEIGYSSILARLMVHRDQFEADYMDAYYKAAAEMIDMLRFAKVHNRPLAECLGSLLAVFDFFKDKVNWPMGRDEFVAALTKAGITQEAKL